jgi:hypothetical protein
MDNVPFKASRGYITEHEHHIGTEKESEALGAH